jgi:hypothetical protein
VVGRRATLIGVALCLALSSAVASPAGAVTNPTKKPQPVKTGDSPSGTGDPARAHAGHCTLYATASPFGASCPLTGGETVLTVQMILDRGHDILPTCWDEILRDPDRRVIYYIESGDPLTYSIRSCVSHIDPDKTPRNQPDEQLDESVVSLGVDPQPCDRPYKPVELDGNCIMTLTGVQQTIVGAAGPRGQIPSVVLDTLPSQRIRTNELTTWFDTVTPDGSNDPHRTKNYPVEPGVVMWAEMAGSFLYPYGAGTTPAIACDITVKSGPNACTWAYPRSSGDQPNELYPLRVETDWRVMYTRGGGAAQQLGGLFKKFDDVGWPVFDVQSIVVS